MWLQDTKKEKITGAYVQTEIGHGSDVQSLQTTVVYDHDTKEFVVNTPDVKAIKFWPGEVALTSTHIVLFGRLIVNAKDHGVQAFLFQIRDSETHRLFKGLEAGDIGPKYGYKTKDNGYILFDNFRIPKNALLSRYISITEKGELKMQGNPKIAYGAMLQLRIKLIEYSSGSIFSTLEIAIRYGLFRKQFRTLPKSQKERSIFDYQSTQAILMKVMAYSFSCFFVSKYLNEEKDIMIEEIQKGKFQKMKDLHSQVSALKAYYCQGAMDCMAACRECCGAHGYLQYAGFAFFQDTLSPNVTLEGDGYVLYQQTARDIFKHLSKLAKGDLIEGEYEYLNEIGFISDIKHEEDTFTFENLLQIVKVSALNRIMNVGNLLRSKDGLSFDEKWNKKYLYDIVNCAKKHAVFISAKIFLDKLETVPISKGLRENLEILYQIYVTDLILQYGDDALLSGYITSDHMNQIEQLHQDLVRKIAPRALSIVDSTHWNNRLLRSVIASPEDPYSEIYNYASRANINIKDKLDSQKYVTQLNKKLIARI